MSTDRPTVTTWSSDSSFQLTEEILKKCYDEYEEMMRLMDIGKQYLVVNRKTYKQLVKWVAPNLPKGIDFTDRKSVMNLSGTQVVVKPYIRRSYLASYSDLKFGTKTLDKFIDLKQHINEHS
jgi:gamma-glutamyl phosphate reductase